MDAIDPIRWFDTRKPPRGAKLRKNRVHQFTPARVNLFGADFLVNHCVVVLSSSGGSLIHATVGSSGGVGGLATKRSGCTA